MSKGLDALNTLKVDLFDHRLSETTIKTLYQVIEKELKVLETIKEIGFHESEYIMCVEYNTYCESRDNPIPKEPFDLLKEVLA